MPEHFTNDGLHFSMLVSARQLSTYLGIAWMIRPGVSRVRRWRRSPLWRCVCDGGGERYMI